MNASERTRSVMEYLYSLETQVRQYRAVERRSKLIPFVMGFLCGAGLGAGLLLLQWLQHR